MSLNRSRRKKILGFVLVLIVVFITGSIAGGLSQASLTNVCSQTNTQPPTPSNGNCVVTFCQTYSNPAVLTGGYQCSFLSAGQECTNYVVNTGLDIFTSTTYTPLGWNNGFTYGGWDCGPANTSIIPGDNIICWAGLNYILNLATSSATFRIKDYSGTLQVSPPFEIGAALTNNMTIAIGWQFVARTVSDQIKLDIRVTGAGQSISVGSGFMFCKDVNPSLQGGVIG